TNELIHAFDYDAVKAKLVEIDLTDARVWDTSAVAALDTVVAKFADRGIEAKLIGLNKHAHKLHERTTGRVGSH
ncbi:MAG: STAS domain-containing protein, partial [Actinomycetota bacterium]